MGGIIYFKTSKHFKKQKESLGKAVKIVRTSLKMKRRVSLLKASGYCERPSLYKIKTFLYLITEFCLLSLLGLLAKIKV